uniref:MULE transposase domain-containing protein n=1 Tax=Lactuca sativa TaxID=4236 RepID=A0A9R1UJP0_LACSA|nr:hypothetical protein LSAT_V11C900494640 [Lactuca sativa]
MPLGVSSTQKTFSIGFAFIHREKEANYTWVLNYLRSTFDKCMLPHVIITDREFALINAFEISFYGCCLITMTYTENYKQLQSMLTDYPCDLRYVMDTWLKKYT